MPKDRSHGIDPGAGLFYEQTTTTTPTRESIVHETAEKILVAIMGDRHKFRRKYLVSYAVDLAQGLYDSVYGDGEETKPEES